jgi:Phospholipase_D-nuclease N-terminal
MSLILGLVILGMDIWALMNVWGSGATVLGKLLWTLLILIAPLIGVVIWYALGPKVTTMSRRL